VGGQSLGVVEFIERQHVDGQAMRRFEFVEKEE